MPHSLPIPIWQRASVHQAFHVLHHCPGFSGLGLEAVYQQWNFSIWSWVQWSLQLESHEWGQPHSKKVTSKSPLEWSIEGYQYQGSLRERNHNDNRESMSCIKSVLSNFSLNTSSMNNYCSVTTSLLSTDSRNVQLEQICLCLSCLWSLDIGKTDIQL